MAITFPAPLNLYLPLAGGTLTGGLVGTTVALGGATLGGNALAVTGTVLLNSAVTMGAAVTYGGVTLTNAVTGNGKMVLDNTPTLITPVLGVATGTSLALNGATLGTDKLAVTGTSTLTGAVTITGAASISLGLTVGSQGLIVGGRAAMGGNAAGDIVTYNAGRIGFASSTDPTAAPDQYLSRVSATAMQTSGQFYATAATPFGTKTTATNGAAAQVGTMTNAPTAGNPTKWVPFDDNGTTRYIPMW